ncbi:MAG: hypothetical protein WC749_05750 [Dehalococcoidia bacterium]
MDRVLTWHLASFIEGTEAQGPTYYMEKDYDPGHVRIHARIAPDGGDFKADIRVDGVSVFTSEYATLYEDETLADEAEDYDNAAFPEGSLVTCHVMAVNGAKDVTIHLELAAVEQTVSAE